MQIACQNSQNPIVVLLSCYENLSEFSIILDARYQWSHFSTIIPSLYASKLCFLCMILWNISDSAYSYHQSHISHQMEGILVPYPLSFLFGVVGHSAKCSFLPNLFQSNIDGCLGIMMLFEIGLSKVHGIRILWMVLDLSFLNLCLCYLNKLNNNHAS